MLREALRLRQAAADRLRMVECLEGLAAAAARADPALAARLLGMAAAGRQALGAPPPPLLRPELAATERAARTALDAAAYNAARAAGEALPLDEAAAEALREPAPWVRAAWRQSRSGDAPAAAAGDAVALHAAAVPVTGDHSALPALAATNGTAALTPREREVAGLIAAGRHTDRHIADRLIAAWVAEHLTALLPRPPQVIGGGVILQRGL